MFLWWIKINWIKCKKLHYLIHIKRNLIYWNWMTMIMIKIASKVFLENKGCLINQLKKKMLSRKKNNKKKNKKKLEKKFLKKSMNLFSLIWPYIRLKQNRIFNCKNRNYIRIGIKQKFSKRKVKKIKRCRISKIIYLIY